MILLAGDLGGTKTNLAVFSSAGGLHAPLAQATRPSADYPSLEALVRDFLGGVSQRIDRAVFGVAGPVVGGQARITNLSWFLDETHLRAELGCASVRLLNDLAAIAQAIHALRLQDLHTLRGGESQPGGAIAIVAPGTGLGEAFLVWDGSRYLSLPSEGGHADFAPGSLIEVDLLRYLYERFDHVSYERVCSGHGLPNIYAFLKDTKRVTEPPWLADRLAAADDQAPIIVEAALGAEPPAICVRTLEIFASILGAEAGNLALKVLATGGVYLGGGIPPRILSILEGRQFREAFSHKGRVADLLANVPVHVILNPMAALLGAASFGFASNDG